MTLPAPHTPTQPPRQSLLRVIERERPNYTEPEAMTAIDHLADAYDEWEGPGPYKHPAALRMLTVALIEHMDEQIGRVLDALDANGQASDTLVFFCSDNGGVPENGSSNGPLRSGKAHVYEGGVRVGAAVRWPTQMAAGTRLDTPMMMMDVLPTFCGLAGVPIPHAVEGRSFLSVLEDGTERPFERDDIYFFMTETCYRYALRRGNLKVLQDDDPPGRGAYEVYDIAADPGEHNDLSNQHIDSTELIAALEAAVSPAREALNAHPRLATPE